MGHIVLHTTINNDITKMYLAEGEKWRGTKNQNIFFLSEF